MRGRESRCKHRIDKNKGSPRRIGKFDQIFNGPFGLRITIAADMANACVRDQFQQAVSHAQPSPQNWNNRQFFAGNHAPFICRERGRYVARRERQIAGDFIAEEQGNLAQQLAKFLGRCGLLTHQCQLVLNQGVFGDVQVGELMTMGHAFSPNFWTQGLHLLRRVWRPLPISSSANLP